MQGVICAVRHHGTIVRLWVQGERLFPVDFDHRPFRQMQQSEGDLVGREVVYHAGPEPTVEFVD